MLIEWLSWVKLADTESVRVMLGAVAGREVSRAVAARRIRALKAAGLIDSALVQTRAHQVVWPTKLATGSKPMSPYGFLAVHQLAVASSTAWAATAGAVSKPDQVEGVSGDKIADGVLLWPNGAVEFLEAELSVKKPSRVKSKLAGMRHRWSREQVAGTLYVAGNAEVERLIRRSAEQAVGVDAGRVRCVQLAEVGMVGAPAALPPPAEPIEAQGERSLDDLRWS